MSSFRKRNVPTPTPGTRTSPQTGQVITSSGNPSLDLILGGGLPIGSLCLIEEDKYVTHSKVLAKYFLAEGVLSQQSIFLGSLDDDPAELLRKLPQPLNQEEVEQELAAADKEQNMDSSSPKNGLRIAWRYNDLPLVNSEQTTAKIGHHFNLLQQMDPLLLHYAETVIWNDAPVEEQEEENKCEQFDGSAAEDDNNMHSNSTKVFKKDNDDDVKMEDAADDAGGNKEAEICINTVAGEAVTPPADIELTNMYKADKPYLWEVEEQSVDSSAAQEANAKLNMFENSKYLRLLNEIQPMLRENKFTVSGNGIQKGLCRICITSLGSPLWYDSQCSKDLLKFLTVLRASVRSAMAVCFITMPMHLLAKCDDTLVPKIRNLVDYAIELESLAGSERETNPAFKEYNGLLHMRKITAINTLSAYMPETTDLAFKLRRKKFVIEKLHLPPELQENNNDVASNLSCGAGGVNNDNSSNSNTVSLNSKASSSSVAASLDF